jgi:nucleotide-binding universal stress UspA family protein
MKVLLAVDGSAYTKRMLAWLAVHDELLDPQTEYTVLTVVTEIPPHAGFFDLADPQGFYQEQAEEVLRPVRAFIAQQRWRADVEHSTGHPAQVISDAATRGAFDLVVLGSHGHSALGNLVLGSVASGVLARCKTPALLIR